MTFQTIRSILLLPRGASSIESRSPSGSTMPVVFEVSTRSRENVMAYIRLPLGIRVAVEYEVFGKIVVNIYHVTTTDPIITLKLLDIAEVFEAWWDANLSDEFSQDIALTTVTALNLNEENGEKLTLVVSPPIAGTVLSDAVPNNVAIVTSFATAKTGRSFRGRSYQAGLTESSRTGNVIGITRATAIIAAYGDLVTLLDVQNAELVVASFQTLGAPRELGVATPVESISVDLRLDTQRRRLPKA